MSAKITEIIGSDGEKIYIQYDEADSDELQAVGYIDDIGERSKRLQKMMIGTVRNYSGLILDSVKQGITDKAPSKVKIEFGLQAGGETGVPFITKGSAQANVKVTIESSHRKILRFCPINLMQRLNRVVVAVRFWLKIWAVWWE